MTLIYYNPRFLDHDTGTHPENAGRLQAVAQHLDAFDMWRDDRVSEWPEAKSDWVTAVHDADYIRAVEQLAASGGGHIDADTVISPPSYGIALLAAGAAVDAVRRVVTDSEQQALCLVRPPGHHAVRSHAMGFCLVNNVAVAARAAIDHFDVDRVLVVDWDVHHGNGTQDLFYDSSRVAFFSAHRAPFYPGTGAADETGTGDGLGSTRNLPMKFGVSRDRYLAEFTRELGDFADQWRPQLVLVTRRLRRSSPRSCRLPWPGVGRLRVPYRRSAGCRGSTRRWATRECPGRRLQPAYAGRVRGIAPRRLT